METVTQVPPEVVLFVGLQGAGKSSFYRAHFASTHLHLSKDLWPNAKHKHKRQDRELRAAVGGGLSVVIDNTNAAREERATSIAIAREFGVRVVAYGFESDLNACLERNALRTGRARVPDVGLFVTLARLQMPTFDEGFDAIFTVRLESLSGFEVEAQLP